MAKVLESLSQDLAGQVEATGPAIVRVEGRRRLPASGVIWSDDGQIVTAHHVLERDQGLRIGLADGTTVEAKLIGRDPTTDLALLQADGAGPGANWQDTDMLSVGHLVLALGRPRRTVQATLGIVSALGQVWRTPIGGQVDRYLQTDVVMYPGFSGGPLVAADGAVVGLNSSALLRGVSLTVPTETIRRVAAELGEHGRVRRGYLGVAAQPAELPKAVAGELGREIGLLLVTVEADSPAEAAGLALGDTIVALDGLAVETLDDLGVPLSPDRIGAEVSVQVLRGGELMERKLTIGERPSR
ncbi:MAG TPA: trypsin-like peptidase domain-containing protein [Anaerolineales bacterium]|jgi:S1-C subfamily serine protease